MYFKGIIDFKPSFDWHSDKSSQNRYKESLSLLEKLINDNRYVYVFGMELGYKEAIPFTMQRLLRDVKVWLELNKKRDGERLIKGCSVQIDKGLDVGKPYARAILYLKILSDRYREYGDLFRFNWDSVTRGEGIYIDETRYSAQAQYEYQTGYLEFVHRDDTKRLERLCLKLGYNTKTVQSDSFGDIVQEPVFICEEYE